MEYMNKKCSCGKEHTATVDKVIVGSGVVSQLPDILKQYGIEKPFILSDKNTFEAAGKRVCDTLEAEDIPFSSYTFKEDTIEPDEHFVGSAVMHFDIKCDAVIGIGSGVINDISKILSSVTDRKYIIVATAPSMDGYASILSSVAMDGLKVSLPSKCAQVIIGDTDILKNAPLKMLKAGIGDMLAKYVSVCEWRISHLITGEYYCEDIANYIRDAVKCCVDNADGLLRRESAAVEAVFRGLVSGGIAMAYAGMPRPASGVEHYFSHLWDMRGLEFGTPVDLHGIQTAIGTLISVKLYEQMRRIIPDRQKALNYAKEFDIDVWNRQLSEFLGKGANAMIALDKKEQKYCTEKHRIRLETIIEKWNDIINIMNEELPSYEFLLSLMKKLEMPTTVDEIGLDSGILSMSFKATKDIRDKYVLSRLAWDLGVIEEMEI